MITGNKKTRDYIILRELEIRVGEPLDEEALQRDILHLLNLGVFSDVVIEHQAVSDSEIVFIRLEERFRIMPYPMFTYSEEDKWSYGGGILYRNFTGRNQTLSLYGLFGGITEYSVYFYDPWIAGERISFKGEVSRQERDNHFEDFHQTTSQLWGEIGRQWQYRLWLYFKCGYMLVESDKPGKTMTGERFDSMPFIQFTGIYDTRDLWSNPSRGTAVTGKLGQFGLIGEKPDFRFLQLTAAKFFPLEWGRTIGIMAGFSQKNGFLPEYERFHLGGWATVRGLELNRDQGNRELLTGFEYRVDILKTRHLAEDFDFGIGGTIFFDNGAVWNGGDSIDELKFYNGFGFGFRFLMPVVEVLRLDAAWTPNSKYRIVAAMGAKF